MKIRAVKKVNNADSHGGIMDKNLPANEEDVGSIPGPEDSTCLRVTNTWCHNY